MKVLTCIKKGKRVYVRVLTETEDVSGGGNGLDEYGGEDYGRYF